ncbi:MAG: pilus assembly protein [Actinomycetota bacterium]|nr:pilus assembly protein [Actinomycetota bacterium]
MVLRDPLTQERGAAAVEFALILPMLLLLIFGMIDFSRAYNAHISLSGAAREGARVLALGTGDPVQTTKDAAPSLPPDEITVALNPADCAGSAGQPANVTASYDFSYITPLSGLMSLFGGSALASPITLNGIGVMRCGG